MAKAKSPQKTTELSRKASGESSPEPSVNPRAATSESTEARENAALLEGIDQTALVNELLADDTRMPTDGQQLALVLKQVSEVLSDLHRKLSGIQKPADPQTVTRLCEKWVKERQLMNSRVGLWQSERRQTEHKDSKYHLPRPSIIGRTLHVLGAVTERLRQTAGPIFREIKQRGPHHLKTPITGYLEAYGKPGEKSEMAGKLKKQLEPRLEILRERNFVEIGRTGCWLTPRGTEVFDGWPDYEVLDDDRLCLGERISASLPAAVKGTGSSATGSAARAAKA